MNDTETHGFRVGDRVRHPARPEWGIGKICAIEGPKVQVFFVRGGMKNLIPYRVPLTILVPPPTHPLLDQIDCGAVVGDAFQSIDQSTKYFLDKYPGGFHGDLYRHEERRHKVEAHQLAETNLSQAKLERLLATGAFEDLCQRAMQVVNKTNLIFPNEKMALRDGLIPAARKEQFAVALHALLHGKDKFELRFRRFAFVLREIGAAKWTVATYFPYLMYPDRYQFIKPTYTKNAARICGFDIKYTPKPSWQTYERMLAFSNYLRSELAVLKPRDNIDVQSFMWAIAQR